MKISGSESFRKVPGNFRSWKQKFQVGTFAPRSKNSGKRKVPEPGLWLGIRYLYGSIQV